MASLVEICNFALSRLGADRITSLSDNTQSAKLCNVFIDDVVREVMTEGDWTTLIRRQALVQTSNTPTYGYDYEFQLPTNPECLRVLAINEIYVGDYDFRIEDDKLLINESSVSVRFIGRITDPETFGPMLTKAIKTRLTAELAYPITGSDGLTQMWFDKYERELMKALAIDGQQGSPEQTQSNDLDDVR